MTLKLPYHAPRIFSLSAGHKQHTIEGTRLPRELALFKKIKFTDCIHEFITWPLQVLHCRSCVTITLFMFCIGRYKKAVLVNVFQWFNKGDHLITIGQRRILQRMGIELIYHCFYPGRDCDFSKIDKNDPELVCKSIRQALLTKSQLQS